jgi:hypothetical protein
LSWLLEQSTIPAPLVLLELGPNVEPVKEQFHKREIEELAEY